MCGGGGNAAQAAQDQEAVRRQQVADATGRVNNIFDSPARQAQYTNFGDSLRQYLTGELARKKTIADRNLKFSLARSGNTGSSVAADQNATLGDEFTRGTLDAERKVQGGVADLRSSDEAARLNLTNLATSGVDTGTAATQAAATMRTNLQRAQGAATVDGLGDVFSSTAKTVQDSADAAAKRRQTRYATLGLY